MSWILIAGAGSPSAWATGGGGEEPEECGQQAVNVCIMLDRTGSVSSSERTNEATAAKTLVGQIANLDNGTRVAIGRFGDGSNGGLEAEIVKSIATVTPGNLGTFETSINNALASGSSVGTNVKDAINVCKDHLINNNNGNQNILILISDFDPNEPTNPDSSALTAATNAKGAGVRIFAIGFDNAGANTADNDNRALGASIASGNSSDNFCTSSVCGSTQINAENTDGDDWFISPTASGLTAIFDSIFEVIQCEDDGNPCTVEACNEQGLCGSSFIPNCKPCQHDNECDDGNACNGDEFCGGNGTCQAGTSLTCNDNSLCTTDSCNPASGCVFTPKTCDDGLSCSVDSCNPQDGQCSFDTSSCECDEASDCNDGNACTDNACVQGECVYTNDNGNSCDDGLFCNGTESCDAGECKHSGDPCAAGGECADSCDEETNSCNDEAGTSCNDGDGNACTSGECNGDGACVSHNNDAECDDGNPCTLDDECSGGDCAGTPKSCDDGVSCTPDSCNEGTGECENPTGECECVTDGDCDDGNECTTEFCNDQNQCERSNNENECDDGLFCNGSDTCGGGTCSVHAGDPCGTGGECANSCNEETDSCNDPAGTPCTDDGKVCTTNTCNGDGECVSTDNELGCDDGNPCTENDTCSEGECNPGTEKDCADERSCSEDSCNEGTGLCEHDLSECGCSLDADCNDGDPCTVDSCNQDSGTCDNSEIDTGATCDDNDACTIDDQCDAEGVCGGVTLNCDDGEVCTEDSCNTESGCVNDEIPECGNPEPTPSVTPDPTPPGTPRGEPPVDSPVGGEQPGGPVGGEEGLFFEGSGCALNPASAGDPSPIGVGMLAGLGLAVALASRRRQATAVRRVGRGLKSRSSKIG
ncbi:MAG TPA: vWA domain-containing protein [bacterium]|nr:vWA domain-containing protein [bacterium]